MRIYTLDNKGLTEEQIAVTFAMTSRSPDPFDEISERVSEAKAADFNEKWVVDYGHASVAEHAVVHLAVEDISRLACDSIENNRLASYTEKSSRYQVIGKDSFHVPSELDHDLNLKQYYIKKCNHIFQIYHELIEECIDKLKLDNPPLEKESNSAYHLRLRRIATDACRGVLPAATLTNVGITANARTLEYAISKLLSSNLYETINIGETIHTTALNETPTLIKYAKANPYLMPDEIDSNWILTGDENSNYVSKYFNSDNQVIVCSFDPTAINQIAMMLSFRMSQIDFNSIVYNIHKDSYIVEFDPQQVYNVSSDEVDKGLYDSYVTSEFAARIIKYVLDQMGPHDSPPREFEIADYMLWLKMDYGALREFRRHRMQSPIFRPLTVDLGVNIPTTIYETDLTKKFLEATAIAGELYHKLGNDMHYNIAQYAVTHTHYQEVVTHLNLRELYHIFKLRTSDKAHESIRVPMKEALNKLSAIHPVLFEPLMKSVR